MYHDGCIKFKIMLAFVIRYLHVCLIVWLARSKPAKFALLEAMRTIIVALLVFVGHCSSSSDYVSSVCWHWRWQLWHAE